MYAYWAIKNADDNTLIFFGIIFLVCMLYLFGASLYFWIQDIRKENAKKAKYYLWLEEYQGIVSWEVFDKEWIYCERCKSYNTYSCICYAR